MRRWGGLLLLILFGLASTTASADAQDKPAPPGQEPVLFKADKVRNEEKLGLIVATGHVEFTQGTRTLLADTVSYNQRTDTVTADGNVSLLEPTGEVVFADHVQLTGDMRHGVIQNIRILLSDNSRFAAAGGRRTGDTTVLSKAVYSACQLCKKDPTQPPIWQVKSVQVIHDQVHHDIQYKDAFIEFYGVPVLYTPYLSHPDPTVKRRSGFLVPSYGDSSDFGPMVTTPYYFNIAPDMDATFSPIFLVTQAPVAAGEFRQRLANGEYNVHASGTYADRGGSTTNEFRGHVRGKFRYDINPTWRGGSDVYLASDDTYLRRYGFGSEDTLENRLFLEGFRGRNYAAANAYYFQGQRSTDDPGKTPFVFPMLDYNFVGEPGRYGGHWLLDANALGLSRTQSTDTYRVSLKPEWELPYVSPLGEVYRLYASVQADGYLVHDVTEPDSPSNTLSGLTGRFFPQAGADWRLPMVRKDGTITQLIEPVLGFVVAPKSQNFDRIPNEDSLSVEFDDTNLMSPNRFTGLDRVEGGTRVSYGLHGSVTGLGGGYSSFFVGQSYRLTKSTDFGTGTGLEDHFSDIVGRIRVSPLRYLSGTYRFRLDKDNLTANRNELQATAGVKALNLSLNYLSVKQQSINDVTNPQDEFGDRKEITLGLNSQVTKYWSGGINTQRDLQSHSSLSSGAYLRYEDDCFVFRADLTRTFTHDRDIGPTDTILFKIVLKTLGQFQTSTAAD